MTPTASPGSTLVDSANAQGQQADPNTANNSASLSLPVRGVSNLSVTGSVQPGSGYVGQPMTYTIDVTNQGPNDEPDAVLSSNLPAGLVVDSTSSTQGADPPVSQGILTADLGLLPAGAHGGRDPGRHARPLRRGPAHDRASRSRGRIYDPDPTDNTAAVTSTVVATSDLGVVIAPSSGPAMAQVDWSYSVQVTNNGPSAATGVVATIPLPAGVQFASASSGQGSTPTQQGGVLTADLGDIASGGSATITIVIDPTPASSGTSISLSAEVAGQPVRPESRQQSGVLEPGDRPFGQRLPESVIHAAGRAERPDGHFHRLGEQRGSDAGDRRPGDLPLGERPDAPLLVPEPGDDGPGLRPVLRSPGRPGPRRVRPPSP